MSGTSDLIDRLASRAPRVRRLRSPLVRIAGWALVAIAIMGAVCLLEGIRPDLMAKLHDPMFATTLGSALATGFLGAAGCLLASLPDRSRLWLLLPIPTLLLWASNICYTSLMDWVVIGPDGFSLAQTVSCIVTIVCVSIPLSAATFAMLHYAGRLRPAAVTLTAGIAVAAMTSAAMYLFHQMDATPLVLVWNVGFACVVALFDSLIGPWLLRRTSVID